MAKYKCNVGGSKNLFFDSPDGWSAEKGFADTILNNLKTQKEFLDFFSVFCFEMQDENR